MVVMGRVAAPFGVQGWVKVEPWSADPASLCKFPAWWVGRDAELQRVAVAECRRHGAFVIARFEGCNDRDQAGAFRDRQVAVRREELPRTAQNEFYQADLIGLDVANAKGERLGRLTGFLDNGVQPVMRVGHDGGERLIPFVAPVVRGVNPAAGKIEVEWELDW